MSRRAVLAALNGPVSHWGQVIEMYTYATGHDLTPVAIAVDNPAAAVDAVRAGTAEVILACRADTAGVLELSGQPLVLVHVPRQRQSSDRPVRPLRERTIAGIPGRLLLGALERLAGDVRTVALAFNLPVDVVVELDVERRARPAVAA